MDFPVTVIKDNVEAKVTHPVDLKGWLDIGFKIKGEKEPEKPTKRNRSKKDEE